MFICIDAGHGGRDLGAAGHGAVEKWVTAEVAARTGELLDAAGCFVFLTRIGDRQMSSAERAAVARETGADLFLSLHCGYSSRSEQRGLAVYYPRGDRPSQAWATLLADGLETRLNGRMVTAGARPISWRHRWGGARLLKVARDLMPACQLDLGFLSNLRDAQLLQDRLFLEELARGISGAAMQWQREMERLLDGARVQ